jgi:hypothetical protein
MPKWIVKSVDLKPATLSAKLLIIAWTLMKKKEPFNPDYLNIE